MNTWRLLLYGFAAFLSLRALVSLISRHQRYYIQQRLYDEQAKVLEAEREEKAAEKIESKKISDMARRAAELEKEAETARAVKEAQATARAAAEEALLAEEFAAMGGKKKGKAA